MKLNLALVDLRAALLRPGTLLLTPPGLNKILVQSNVVAISCSQLNLHLDMGDSVWKTRKPVPEKLFHKVLEVFTFLVGTVWVCIVRYFGSVVCRMVKIWDNLRS